MTDDDDIVERLRRFKRGPCLDAADEIERLRAERTCARCSADRIRELSRELARANQRLGLYQHHASKKKAKP